MPATRRIVSVLAAAAAVGALTGCGQRSDRPPADGAGPAITDLANAHFAVSLQQRKRKVPIRQHTAALRRETFDVLVALPMPGGVFVHASTSPRMYDLARQGGDLAAALPLRGIPEHRSTTLALTDEGWQYWYYLGPGISKFTAMRIVDHPRRGRTYVGKKSLRSFRTSGGDERGWDELEADALYVVFVKGDWNAARTARVEQAREWLRIALP